MNGMLLACIAVGLLAASCAPRNSRGPAGQGGGQGLPGQGSPVTDIPKIEGVTVGDTVSDWKGQGMVIRALAGDNATSRPASEFEVVGRLGWNDEGVLLQVDVTDTTPFEVESIGELYRGDSVELFLTTDAKTIGVAQLIASPGRTKDQKDLRYRLFDYRNMAFKKDCPPFKPRAVVQKTDRGYVMDMILPFAVMKVKPQPGTVVGVRFCVNDGERRARGQGGWNNYQLNGGWDNFPQLRLADKPGTPCPIAAWGGYDEIKSAFVSAIAEPQLAGKTITVLEKDKVIAQGQLAKDGGRATVQLRMPFPAIGKTMGPLTVQFEGQKVQTVQLPDPAKVRKDMFLSGQRLPDRNKEKGKERDTSHDWLTPAGNTVFTGREFPTFAYPEPQRIKELVGSFTIDTAYYDAQFNRVTKPAGPGRYGAVTTVVNADGDFFTLYQTLYCQPNGAAPTTQPAMLVAAAATRPSASEFDAAKADREWWYSLRKKLGNAPRYEYFVHLPAGYDNDPNKKWPVIFYMHGSGRGEDGNRARKDGPQGPATQQSDFGFIVVSLRSPGGWQPPAVNEVIDAVAATCRTDPKRYYLCGFSMGAMGTWTVALDRPERFAAIAVVGGRDGEPKQADLLKGMGIWVINGADDTSTTSADAVKMVQALQKVGAEVEWTEIPYAGHNDSDDLAYRWPELYEWFLKHHR